MTTVTFDTLKFVKTLEAAGIPVLQAKALSDAVRDAHEAADVATKRDVDDVRKDMQAMEARIDAKFEKFELRLTVKLGSIVVFALGALTVLSKGIA